MMKDKFWMLVLALGMLTAACGITTFAPTLTPVSRAPVATVPATEVSEIPSGALFEPNEFVGESYQVCECESLNVRSMPGVEGGVVVAWLTVGQGVRVMETRGEWAKLSTGGWVHKGYLCQ